ncbi:MAG: NAD+ synthase, partial [Verrucomicrobia bacterium]|nr:NAD+ synthase [Verrucomicrobiota bacterium]
MKIGILQVDLTVGDFAGNSGKILRGYEKVVREGADLVLAPELGLCGYPPRDLLNREDFLEAHDRALRGLAAKIGKIPLLTGGIERFRGRDGRPLHNAAFLLQQKKLRVVARKVLLPTYDVFDEDRYFEPGGDSRPIRIGKTRVG